jgi:hypothetical protein
MVCRLAHLPAGAAAAAADDRAALCDPARPRHSDFAVRIFLRRIIIVRRSNFLAGGMLIVSLTKELPCPLQKTSSFFDTFPSWTK